MVQEDMIEEIDGQRINPHGNSYSFLEQGNITNYYIDTFVGKLAVSGK